jgi:hypothetical protein
MADAAESNERIIKNIRRILRMFRNIHAPQSHIGRRRNITPPMLKVPRNHLLEKLRQYLDETATFLWDEFQI